MQLGGVAHNISNYSLVEAHNNCDAVFAACIGDVATFS
jgi:hypothetical protein